MVRRWNAVGQLDGIRLLAVGEVYWRCLAFARSGGGSAQIDPAQLGPELHVVPGSDTLQLTELA